MIKVVVFDLDGTLVQTETIKAISYGEAAEELCPPCTSVEQVTEAFKDVVGRSRQEVSEAIMKRFGLEEASKARMEELGVKEPWQAYAETRMHIYKQMLDDSQLLRSNRLMHNIDLLYKVRKNGFKTALATTSSREQAMHVLDVLGIKDQFDYIATADDVKHNKPDPEIYKRISKKLNAPPNEMLAIEDSPAGIESAISAGVKCIAVTTDFTKNAVHKSNLLDKQWIVDDPAQLQKTFDKMTRKQDPHAKPWI